MRQRSIGVRSVPDSVGITIEDMLGLTAWLETIGGGDPTGAVAGNLSKRCCSLASGDIFYGDTIDLRHTLAVRLAISGFGPDQTEGGEEEEACQVR